MLQNELVDPAGNSFLVMSLCNVINNKIVNSIQATENINLKLLDLLN